MPELPEVETICGGLRPLLRSRRIAEVRILERRLRRTIAAGLHRRLQGKTILDVERRGKYILIPLAGDAVWIFHLGMSGKLIRVAAQRPVEKHDHIIIGLDDGYQLRYHDPRRFGLSILVARGELASLPQLRDLGLEPFDRRFDGDYLYSITRRSRRRIRDLLIDQRVVAGLGNIYANEILFRAGIRPATRAWRLGKVGAGKIASVVPGLLREAIRWCGTTFSDYRDAEDRLGEFQNHLRVYDREGERCRVCDGRIRRTAIGSRSAFYCPTCQR